MISREQFVQAGAYLAIVDSLTEGIEGRTAPMPEACAEFLDSHANEAESLIAEIDAEILRLVETQREIAQAILDGAVR